MKAPVETEKIEHQKNETQKDDFTITHFENDDKTLNVGSTSESLKMDLMIEKELEKVDVAEEAPVPIKPEPFKQQYRKHNHEVQLDYTLLKSEVRNGQTPLIAVHGWMDNKSSF